MNFNDLPERVKQAYSAAIEAQNAMSRVNYRFTSLHDHGVSIDLLNHATNMLFYALAEVMIGGPQIMTEAEALATNEDQQWAELYFQDVPDNVQVILNEKPLEDLLIDDLPDSDNNG